MTPESDLPLRKGRREDSTAAAEKVSMWLSTAVWEGAPGTIINQTSQSQSHESDTQHLLQTKPASAGGEVALISPTRDAHANNVGSIRSPSTTCSSLDLAGPEQYEGSLSPLYRTKGSTSLAEQDIMQSSANSTFSRSSSLDLSMERRDNVDGAAPDGEAEQKPAAGERKGHSNIISFDLCREIPTGNISNARDVTSLNNCLDFDDEPVQLVHAAPGGDYVQSKLRSTATALQENSINDVPHDRSQDVHAAPMESIARSLKASLIMLHGPIDSDLSDLDLDPGIDLVTDQKMATDVSKTGSQNGSVNEFSLRGFQNPPSSDSDTSDLDLDPDINLVAGQKIAAGVTTKGTQNWSVNELSVHGCTKPPSTDSDTSDLDLDPGIDSGRNQQMAAGVPTNGVQKGSVMEFNLQTTLSRPASISSGSSDLDLDPGSDLVTHQPLSDGVQATGAQDVSVGILKPEDLNSDASDLDLDPGIALEHSVKPEDLNSDASDLDLDPGIELAAHKTASDGIPAPGSHDECTQESNIQASHISKHPTRRHNVPRRQSLSSQESSLDLESFGGQDDIEAVVATAESIRTQDPAGAHPSDTDHTMSAAAGTLISPPIVLTEPKELQNTVFSILSTSQQVPTPSSAPTTVPNVSAGVLVLPTSAVPPDGNDKSLPGDARFTSRSPSPVLSLWELEEAHKQIIALQPDISYPMAASMVCQSSERSRVSETLAFDNILAASSAIETYLDILEVELFNLDG